MPVQAEKKETTSFETILSLCWQRLPPGLLSAADRERHLATARQLPGYFSSMIGFETYIDRPDTDLGMTLAVHTDSSGWRFLTGELPASQEVLFAHPTWQRVRRFCALANGNGSDQAAADFAGHVTGLWFEFDVDEYQQLLPDIYVDCVKSPLRGQDGWRAIEQMSLLLQEQDLAASAATLRRCLAAIPAGGIFYVGLMLARPFRGVRLVVGLGQRMGGVYRYLADVGWPGALPALQEKTAWLDECGHNVVLLIDVDGAVLPGIGLEVYLDTDGRDRERWASLLECFAERGLCHPAKQEALLAFPGGTLEVMGLPFQLTRQLNHVKVVVAPEAPLRAKGYFYFWPTWGKTRKAEG